MSEDFAFRKYHTRSHSFWKDITLLLERCGVCTKRDGTERVVGLLQLRRPEWLPTGEPKLNALHGWRMQDGVDGAAGGGQGDRVAASGIAGCGGR